MPISQHIVSHSMYLTMEFIIKELRENYLAAKLEEMLLISH